MSTLPVAPSYDALCVNLKKHHIESTPAEVHGIFCGLFCAAPDSLTYNPALTIGSDDSPQELQDLYEATRRQFNRALEENELSIQLLLPDDEAPLAERIAALGQWGQGFLSGLGEAGLSQEAIESAELQEVLTDIATVANVRSVAQLDVDNLSEEDEKDYVEICSYLGVAVLSIHTDLLLLQKKSSPADDASTPKIVH